MKPIGVKIVLIGGGTGSFTLLSQLKNYTHNITSLVNMVDDGGSTGQLRDELGVLPPGDVRQCLVALSSSPRVRDLFNYRFDNGGLKGHAFGNLFMAALEKMTGNFGDAVEIAGEVLNIEGVVYPITLDNITLSAKTKDGNLIVGQEKVDEYIFKKHESPWLELTPKANLNPSAKQAIAEADLVVIAPGLLYSSLAPALLVNGLTSALKTTKAKKVYVCNLINKPGQTDDFQVTDYVSEIERFAGVGMDYVIYNNYTPSDGLLEKYARDGEFLVEWDDKKLKDQPYEAIGGRYIADSPWQNSNAASDPLASQRSLIRHDADRVARELMRIYFA